MDKNLNIWRLASVDNISTISTAKISVIAVVTNIYWVIIVCQHPLHTHTKLFKYMVAFIPHDNFMR